MKPNIQTDLKAYHVHDNNAGMKSRWVNNCNHDDGPIWAENEEQAVKYYIDKTYSGGNTIIFLDKVTQKEAKEILEGTGQNYLYEENWSYFTYRGLVLVLIRVKEYEHREIS